MAKKKKATPRPAGKYKLLVAFDAEELALLEALERDMGIRRTPILKLLLRNEAKRRGLTQGL